VAALPIAGVVLAVGAAIALFVPGMRASAGTSVYLKPEAEAEAEAEAAVAGPAGSVAAVAEAVS